MKMKVLNKTNMIGGLCQNFKIMRCKIFVPVCVVFFYSSMFSQQDNSEPFLVFSKPNELIEITSDSNDDRSIYQNEEGVTLAYSKGREVESQEQVEIIAVMSVFALKEILDNFNVLEEDRKFILNDHRYCAIVYSHTLDGQEIVSYSFYSNIKGRLLTFIFSCPIELEEKWAELFIEIMASVRW